MGSGSGFTPEDPTYVAVVSGGGGGGGAGDASAANQTTEITRLTSIRDADAASRAAPGSDATTAQAVQGVTGGKPVPVDTVRQIASAAPAATTITVGGTAQTLFAANSARRGVVLQNQSAGDLYLGGAAAPNQTSLRIPAGGYYETPSTHSGTALVQIYGATTGQAFYAREY